MPLSVAIALNYPGYDIKFIYNEDPDELTNKMFIYIKDLTTKIGVYMIN